MSDGDAVSLADGEADEDGINDASGPGKPCPLELGEGWGLALALGDVCAFDRDAAVAGADIIITSPAASDTAERIASARETAVVRMRGSFLSPPSFCAPAHDCYAGIAGISDAISVDL
ncbi:MAG: hypothetical protein ACXVD2_09565 [Actinomycetota bacterium]